LPYLGAFLTRWRKLAFSVGVGMDKVIFGFYLANGRVLTARDVPVIRTVSGELEHGQTVETTGEHVIPSGVIEYRLTYRDIYEHCDNPNCSSFHDDGFTVICAVHRRIDGKFIKNLDGIPFMETV